MKKNTKKSGQIYIFRNIKHEPNIYKVGRTNRIEERISELNREVSNPGKFIEVASFHVSNCVDAEVQCHKALENKGFKRIKGEFFQGQIEAIKEIIQKICKQNFPPEDYINENFFPKKPTTLTKEQKKLRDLKKLIEDAKKRSKLQKNLLNQLNETFLKEKNNKDEITKIRNENAKYKLSLRKRIQIKKKENVITWIFSHCFKKSGEELFFAWLIGFMIFFGLLVVVSVLWAVFDENNNLAYLLYTYPFLIIYIWKWDKKEELNSLMKLLKKKLPIKDREHKKLTENIISIIKLRSEINEKIKASAKIRIK